MTNDSLKNDREQFTSWLRQALIRNGLSASDLSKRVGVSRQAVNKWMTDGKISMSKLRQVEEILDERSPITMRAFSVLSDTSVNGVTGSTVQSISGHNDVPLIDWKEVGDLSTSTGNNQMVCPVPHNLGKTYALEIKGSAMEEVFNEKDIIFVDDREVNNEDYVIVKFEGDKEALLRRYHKTAGKVTFTAENNNIEDIVDPSEDSYELHGVVIGKFRPF